MTIHTFSYPNTMKSVGGTLLPAYCTRAGMQQRVGGGGFRSFLPIILNGAARSAGILSILSKLN